MDVITDMTLAIYDIPRSGKTVFLWEYDIAVDDNPVQTIIEWLEENVCMTKHKLELERYLFMLMSE